MWMQPKQKLKPQIKSDLKRGLAKDLKKCTNKKDLLNLQTYRHSLWLGLTLLGSISGTNMQQKKIPFVKFDFSSYK